MTRAATFWFAGAAALIAGLLIAGDPAPMLAQQRDARIGKGSHGRPSSGAKGQGAGGGGGSSLGMPQPGMWLEAPSSHLDQASQLPVPTPPGTVGYEAIMTAWSGGTYDANHDCMIVTGGGHADYAGNEIYTWCIGTGVWTRVWGPTPNDQIQQPVNTVTTGDTYLNGDPRSTHNYSGIVYLPDQDKLWRHGGSVWSGSGGFTAATWLFDFPTLTWTQKTSFSGAFTPCATYDSVTHHVFIESYTQLYEVDPVADTATARGVLSAGFSPNCAVAIDQDTRQFVMVGDLNGGIPKVYSYQLDSYPASIVDRTASLTGSTNAISDNDKRPGLTWDSRLHKLVMWNGGTSVYTLDTTTWVIAQIAANAGNTVTPPLPLSGGIYGRWQYMPAHDAYVLINGISNSVYYFKMPDAQITLPTDRWQAVLLPNELSAASGALPGNIKHTTPGFDPVDGRIYFTAGDYTNTGGASSSYRQETWSLYLKDFAENPGTSTGWRLEYPYCGSSGVQPKWPDYGGFHYDSVRHLFWWVAGVTEVNTSGACAGETTDKTDQAAFSFGHVMTFDPVTKTWANAGLSGTAFTHVWDTVFDATGDQLVTIRQGSSTGDVWVETFSASTQTWNAATHLFATPAVSTTLRGMAGYGALDATTRTLYYIEDTYQHLMSLDIATMTLHDLGPLPTVVAMNPGGQPKVAWDSTHHLVYWHNAASGEFFAYHPDTTTWETLTTLSTAAGIEACNDNVMAYDPNQDALIAFGMVFSTVACNLNARPYLFIYRYPN